METKTEKRTKKKKAILLLPQTVCLENVAISRTLIESHIILINTKNSREGISRSGLHLLFDTSKESLFVLSFPHLSPLLPPSLSQCSFNPLIDLSTFFSLEKSFSSFFLFSTTNKTPSLFSTKKKGKFTKVLMKLK